MEDLELMRWCKQHDFVNVADQAWLSVLAVPGKMMLSHPQVHEGRTFLAGHTFVGSCLQGLPVREVSHRGQTFWTLDEMHEIFWLPIVSWQGWKCSTCSWIAPVSVYKKTKSWCLDHTLLLEKTSEERNLLETCAMNAFWEIPKTGLISIARAASIPVDTGKSLPEVMLALVDGVLREQSDSEKLRLLRLRLPRKADLMELLEEASAEQNLEPEDVQQLQQLKKDNDNREQELGPKVRELAERVRSQSSSSSTAASSSRSKAGTGATGTKNKKGKRFPNTIKIDESTTLQELNALLPTGCKFGYDGIDHYWRMSCYGTRYGRSIQLHGREEGAKQLVLLAWKRAIAEGWEPTCPFPDLLQ